MAGTMPSPDGGVNPFSWAAINAKAAETATTALNTDTATMRKEMMNATVGRQNAIMGVNLQDQERQNASEQNDYNGVSPSRVGMLRGTGGSSSSITVDQAPAQYRDLIKNAAAKHGVDANLLASLLNQESGFKSGAVGPHTRFGNAKGMGQFLDDTARSVGITDPFDPAQAIEGSAKYLGMQLQKFGGNTHAALAAYNWGPGNAAKWLANGANPLALPAETRNYINSITGGRKAGTGTAANGATPGLAAAQEGLVAIPKYLHGTGSASEYEPVIGQMNNRGMQLYRKKAPAAPVPDTATVQPDPTKSVGTPAPTVDKQNAPPVKVEAAPVSQPAVIAPVAVGNNSAVSSEPIALGSLGTAPIPKPADAEPALDTNPVAPAGVPTGDLSTAKEPLASSDGTPPVFKRISSGKMAAFDHKTGAIIWQEQ